MYSICENGGRRRDDRVGAREKRTRSTDVHCPLSYARTFVMETFTNVRPFIWPRQTKFPTSDHTFSTRTTSTIGVAASSACFSPPVFSSSSSPLVSGGTTTINIWMNFVNESAQKEQNQRPRKNVNVHRLLIYIIYIRFSKRNLINGRAYS